MKLKIFVVMLESDLEVICFFDIIAKLKWFLNCIKSIFQNKHDLHTKGEI